MKIQVNTDLHAEGRESVAAQVGTTVEHALKQQRPLAHRADRAVMP